MNSDSLQADSHQLIEAFLDREKVDFFLDEAERANRRFNLYSRGLTRRDLEILVAESILPLKLGWITADSGPLLDIGSGWGIPAVPILMALPGISISMAERSGRKADFLDLLLVRLGLKAEVYHRDVFEISSPVRFSTVLSRQVALDEKMVRHIRGLAAPEACLIYFGESIPEDITGKSQIISYSIDSLPVRHLSQIPLI